MRIVFIGGVHGVGKSTWCLRIAERTGMQWFTASALIKAEMQSAIAVDSKHVEDPAGNQDLLIRGLRNNARRDQGKILLDGHFTLLNAAGEIVAVEIDVFSRLGLENIIVIRDDAAAICDRLRDRDGEKWSVSRIITFQDAELSQAHDVARKLSISILVISAFDDDDMGKAVDVLGV